MPHIRQLHIIKALRQRRLNNRALRVSRPSKHHAQLPIPNIALDDVLRLRELRRTVVRQLDARAGEPGGGGREGGGVVVDLALAGFVDELEDGGEGVSFDVGGDGADGGGGALGCLLSDR